MDEKGEFVVTLNENGECVLVSRQNEEHEILSIIWEKPEAPESTIPPPPEGEPPTRDKPKWDPKLLSGNRMLRNPEDAARDVSNFAAPQTPQQAHGDALAVVERIEGNLCGPSGRLNEPVAHIFKSDLDCIRQALTASGVPEGYKLVPVEPTREMLKAGHNSGMGEAGTWAAMIAAAPTGGREE